MSFLKRLFGGSDGEKKSAKIPTVEHMGFEIVPAPHDEGGQFRLAGTIKKEIDGETKEHLLIRADMFPSLEDAREATVAKARRLIDEQGDSLFR